MPSTRSRRLLTATALALPVTLAACSGGAPTARSLPSSPQTQAAPPRTPTPSRTPNPSNKGTLTVSFGGDVHFQGALAGRLANDPATAIGPLRSVLSASDLAMVNLETAITTRGTPVSKQFVFRAPPSAFTALKGAGIDVVTAANNHGIDYGQVGLQDSLDAARTAGFPVVGVGRDADAAYRAKVFTVRGTRVAFIGATQVLDDAVRTAWTAGPDKAGLASAKDVSRTVEAVRAARAEADVVVVYLHWGVERTSCPSGTQQGLAHQLSEAGADVIVGSHAHVLQGAGYLGRTYVDYGLGNFAFYARPGPQAVTGVLTLTLRGRTVEQSRWTPAVIIGGIPRALSSPGRAVAAWQQLRSCTGLSASPTG